MEHYICLLDYQTVDWIPGYTIKRKPMFMRKLDVEYPDENSWHSHNSFRQVDGLPSIPVEYVFHSVDLNPPWALYV